MAVTTDHGRGKSRGSKAKGLEYPEAEGPPTAGQTIVDHRDDRIDTDAGAPEERDEPTTEEAIVLRPLALQRALRDVEATVDAEYVRVQEGMDEIREAEEQLQDRLEKLYLELGSVQDSLVENSRSMRVALDERRDLDASRSRLQAKAVQRTLSTDAEALRARANAWQDRQGAAEARVRAFKDNPALAEQIADFRRLDERLDTLDLLPESYRLMVRQRHTELQGKLAPHLEEPKQAPLETLRLAVAISASQTSADGGRKMYAVLPVDFKTHERAREGKTDLCARFAFRVLAALSRFVVNIGARADPKPVQLGELLGIEVPFDELDLPLSPLDLARALRDSFIEAPDSQMAKVNVMTDMVFVSNDALAILWEEGTEKAKKGKRKR
ncbi:MAG: hypothetical protein KDA24_15515 [Deltaproteobacteria bacterium]|nr:hypothetical protein [Deltaproteobacteria bacterium]